MKRTKQQHQLCYDSLLIVSMLTFLTSDIAQTWWVVLKHVWSWKIWPSLEICCYSFDLYILHCCCYTYILFFIYTFMKLQTYPLLLIIIHKKGKRNIHVIINQDSKFLLPYPNLNYGLCMLNWLPTRISKSVARVSTIVQKSHIYIYI